MAPLHHHYEQKGWKELTVSFLIISVILALIGLSTLKVAIGTQQTAQHALDFCRMRHSFNGKTIAVFGGSGAAAARALVAGGASVAAWTDSAPGSRGGEPRRHSV